MTAIAIVLAGGISSRYHKQTPKQFELFKGRPLVSYALDKFNSCDQIDRILLVLPAKMMEEAKIKEAKIKEATELLNPDQWHKLKHPFIAGGERRCDSCYQALKSLTDCPPDSLVLVHDGARPFVSLALIERSIEVLHDYAGVIPALPVVDSLARVIKEPQSREPSIGEEMKEAGDKIAMVPRRQVFQLQTPQGFSLRLLRAAYDHFYLNEKEDREEHKEEQPEPTDDCSIILNYDKKARLKVIEGERKNMKITYPEDIELLSSYLWD